MLSAKSKTNTEPSSTTTLSEEGSEEDFEFNNPWKKEYFLDKYGEEMPEHPFIRTYIKAKKTGQNVLLLIEEINRANVAAVFGDVFQLLDRGDDEVSEYPIQASEDIKKYLAL